MSTDHNRQDLRDTFLRHRDRLYSVALHIVGTHELADDVLETAYLTLTDSALAVAEKPYDYCAQLVSQLAVDCLRRKSMESQFFRAGVDAHEDEPAMPDAERAAIDVQSITLVQRSLADLPARTLKAFTLYRLDGLTQQQIAQRLDVPLSQVDVMIKDAISRLKHSAL